MIGISAYSVYIPWRRLSRAVIAEAHRWYAPGLKALGAGERAISFWDEDAITMGVEAARGCYLEPGKADPASIYLASTSLPFVDRQNAGLIKEALCLDDHLETSDITGSQRAGTSAMLNALGRAYKGSHLCVASEKSRPKPMSEAELTSGDGAAAFLISDEDVIAEFVASETLSVDFVDHFQSADSQAPYQWETRWVRDEGYGKILPAALSALLEKASLSVDEISHFAFASPIRGLTKRVAKTLGISGDALDPSLESDLGYAGVAHPLLSLAKALESAKPGELILVASFGQGCDLLLFRATDKINEYSSPSSVSAALAHKELTENYLQYLVLNGMLETDQGMRAEQDQKTPLTALYRDRRTVFGLVGGRCTRTGEIQFPKSDVSVSEDEWALGTQEDYRLADLPARIITYTEDRLAFTPAPPYAYGMIEFEGGGRMVAEFADYKEGALKVGAPLRMVFRIKSHDHMRGFARYFWKAVPTDTQI